jgi:starch synthase
MDVVFSDSGDQHGGFYDNNGGLDYHLPVTGAPGQLPGLHVVHVTVEMAPIAKVRRPES